MNPTTHPANAGPIAPDFGCADQTMGLIRDLEQELDRIRHAQSGQAAEFEAMRSRWSELFDRESSLSQGFAALEERGSAGSPRRRAPSSGGPTTWWRGRPRSGSIGSSSIAGFARSRRSSRVMRPRARRSRRFRMNWNGRSARRIGSTRVGEADRRTRCGASPARGLGRFPRGVVARGVRPTRRRRLRGDAGDERSTRGADRGGRAPRVLRSARPPVDRRRPIAVSPRSSRSSARRRRRSTPRSPNCPR